MAEFLTEKEYARLRYHAKKMGVKELHLSCIDHNASFDHTYVSFSFKPLKCKLKLSGSYSIYKGDFESKEDIEAITADMNRALNFVEFLKKFNETIDT